MGGEPKSGAGVIAHRIQRYQVPLPWAVAAGVLLFLFGILAGARGPERIIRIRPPRFKALFLDASHQVNARAKSISDPVTGGACADGAADARLFEAVPDGSEGHHAVDVFHAQVLSWRPRAVLLRGFATPAQCDAVVAAAEPRLTRSHVAYKKGDNEENTKDVRTSDGTFMSSRDEPTGALREIEAKISRATHVPISHGEAFNVLRYDVKQRYASHYDTFDPEAYGPQASQRMISFLIYLSDWDEGGETVFPLEGPGGLERLKTIDYDSCDMGIKVKPKKGDGLMFYSLHPNRTFDKASLHGSCPVARGVKWVATKWIRDEVSQLGA